MAPMTELTTYLTALMNGGVHKGKRLVSEESIEKMFTPYISYSETYWGMSQLWLRVEYSPRLPWV